MQGGHEGWEVNIRGVQSQEEAKNDGDGAGGVGAHHQGAGHASWRKMASRGMRKKPGVGKDVRIRKAGELETVAVMFVDQAAGGLLAKCLQRAEDKVVEMVGYRVRMVEPSGTQLCRLLPCTNPWSGKHCGRAACYMC